MPLRAKRLNTNIMAVFFSNVYVVYVRIVFLAGENGVRNCRGVRSTLLVAFMNVQD